MVLLLRRSPAIILALFALLLSGAAGVRVQAAAGVEGGAGGGLDRPAPRRPGPRALTSGASAPLASLDLAVTSVITGADLALFTSARAGETGWLTYTLTVENAGPDAASGLSIVDALPAELSFVSASGDGWSCDRSGSTLTCSSAGLAAGASSALTIVGTVSASDLALTNTAVVSAATLDPNGANNSHSITTELAVHPDLALNKSVTPESASPGEVLTYTLSTANQGPGAASSVQVVDQLPASAVLVSASGTGWRCSGTATVTCERASLELGVAPDILIVVTAPISGQLVNSATISGATTDPIPQNNGDSVSTTVAPKANLAVLASSATALTTIVYTFTVVNFGPSAASNVVFEAVLDPDLGSISTTPATPTCGVAGGKVSCALGSLVEGASAQVVVRARLKTLARGELANSASVRSEVFDPNEQNNTVVHNAALWPHWTFLPLAMESDTTPPDLAVLGGIKLSPGKLSFTSAEQVQISVTVENRGGLPSGPFWVDLYINPAPVPSRANMPWNEQCTLNPCRGISWYVQSGLPAGGWVTLRSTPESYSPGHTSWTGTFVRGTTDLYVYVDSWGDFSSAGLVAESSESNNRAALHGLQVPN